MFGREKKNQEREILVPPHTELGCVMASHPPTAPPRPLHPLHPFLKVELKRGIMIIEHMNGAQKKRERKEPIPTLHQALAFQGSGGDSEIRRLNSPQNI